MTAPRRTLVEDRRSALVLTAVMLFPVYWMINVSFTRDQDMRKSPPDLFPLHGTLEGYRAVLDQQLPYLGTSLLIGLGTVVLTVALAAPAGYSLAKLRPRGGGVLSFVLLIAQMIPGIIMAMGFYAIYLSLGLLNTVPGLIVADSTIAVPFGVLIFTAFMSGIPDELLQAARIDGAGPLRTFWSVVLPVSRNAIVTVSLFAFLWAWSDFVFASTLDRGGAHAADHPRHLPLHRQQQPAVERHHGHRRRGLHPRHGPAHPRPALRRRRRHRRRRQGLTHAGTVTARRDE